MTEFLDTSRIFAGGLEGKSVQVRGWIHHRRSGGGQRIDDLGELLKRMEEENLDPKDYQWYVDLRRHGSVPHSGFGLRVERTVAWICKLKHIRDAIAFPRSINKVYP